MDSAHAEKGAAAKLAPFPGALEGHHLSSYRPSRRYLTRVRALQAAVEELVTAGQPRSAATLTEDCRSLAKQEADALAASLHPSTGLQLRRNRTLM